MFKKTPTILITHVHSSKNAGDLALLECAIQQARSAFDQPHLIVSANWPQEPYFQSVDYEVVPSPWRLAGIGTRKKVFLQMLSAAYGLLLAWLHSSLHIQPGAPGWRSLLDAYRGADLVRFR
jgi:hypothetical protein